MFFTLALGKRIFLIVTLAATLIVMAACGDSSPAPQFQQASWEKTFSTEQVLLATKNNSVLTTNQACQTQWVSSGSATPVRGFCASVGTVVSVGDVIYRQEGNAIVAFNRNNKLWSHTIGGKVIRMVTFGKALYALLTSNADKGYYDTQLIKISLANGQTQILNKLPDSSTRPALIVQGSEVVLLQGSSVWRYDALNHLRTEGMNGDTLPAGDNFFVVLPQKCANTVILVSGYGESNRQAYQFQECVQVIAAQVWAWGIGLITNNGNKYTLIATAGTSEVKQIALGGGTPFIAACGNDLAAFHSSGDYSLLDVIDNSGKTRTWRWSGSPTGLLAGPDGMCYISVSQIQGVNGSNNIVAAVKP